MAQNVEELAQILNRLQEENKINSEDVNKILVDIKSKVDYLNDNSDENSLLIDSLKEAFSAKKSEDLEKFSELTGSIEEIKGTLSSAISRDDFNKFLENLQAFEANFRQAVSGISYDKQSFFEGIQEELGRVVEKSVILKDLFPQEEQEALNNLANTIKESLEAAKQEVSSNLTGGASALSENIKSVITLINTTKSEIFRNTADNISVLSDDMKAAAGQLDNELSGLKTILTRNFDDSAQLLAGLNDANIKITEIIKTSEQNLADNINNIKTSIDNLFNHLDVIKSELKENSDTNLNKIIETIRENSAQIADFKENVSVNLSGYLTAIKELFITFSEEMKNSQDSLVSDIFDRKLQELEVLSTDIKNLDVNLEQKEDNYKDYVSGKINDIQNFLNSIQENVSSKNEKFDELQKVIEEYTSLVNNFASNNDIKFGETMSEIMEVKDYIAGTSIKLDDIQNNITSTINTNSDKLEELTGTVSNQLNNFNTKLYSISDELRQELNTGNASLKELTGEINTNISGNFNDVKTILECMRANISQCSDNMNGKIDDYNASINNNNEVHKETLSSIQKTIDETLSIINQNQIANLDKNAVIEQKLQSNLDKINELIHSITEQSVQSVTEKCNEISDGMKNEVRENTNFVLQNVEKLLAQLEQAKNELFANQSINRNGIEQAISNNIKISEGNVLQNTEQLSQNITDKFTSVFEQLGAIKQHLEEHPDETPQFTKQLMECINNTENALNENIKHNSEVYSVNLNEKFENLSGQLTEIKQHIEDKPDETTQLLQQLIDRINDIRNELNEDFREKTDEYSNEVAAKFSYINDQLNSIRQYIEENPDASELIAGKMADSINNAKNELSENIKTDFNSVAQSIGALLGQLETAKKDITANHVNSHSQLEQSVIANLKTAEENIAQKTGQFSQDISEKINAISENINSLKNDLNGQNNSESESITDAKNEINKNIKTDFNIIAQSIGGLLAKVEAFKNDITANNAAGRTNLEQSLIANLKTTEEILSANSGKYSEEISGKIEGITDRINEIKSGIEEALQTGMSASSEKLSVIETKLNDISDNYEQNLEMLQTKLGEYITAVDKISEETGAKIDSSLDEFIDIKNEISKIYKQVSSVKDENSTALSGHLTDILDKLNEITGAITDSGNDISSGIKDVVQENSALIDKSLNYITISLDEIKTKQADTYDLYGENLSDKLSSIKQELELVNTDVLNAVNTKSEDLVKEFEPLKDAVGKFLEFDFNFVISEIKNQVELSYLNLLSELKDNLIENHDSYIKIENTYKDIVSRCASLEDYINSFTKDNLELINTTIANIDLTVRSTLEKTNSLAEQWHKDFEAFDEQITQNNNLQELSLTTTLESIKNTLDEKISAGNEELKECLAVMLNNDDVMLALESLGGDVSDKIEEYKSSVESSDRDLKETITGLNNDISGRLDNIKQDLQNNAAQELAENINSQIKEVTDVLKTLHEKVDILAMSDNSEISEDVNTSAAKILDAVEELHKKVDVLALSDTNDDDDKISDTIAGIADEIKSLHSKVDVLAMSDTSEVNEEISDTIAGIADEIKSLHSKVDVLAMSDNSEVNEEISDTIAGIADEIKSLHSKVDVLAMSDNSEVNEEISDNIAGIADEIKSLHSKVDVLAMSDNSDLQAGLDDIHGAVLEQNRLLEQANNRNNTEEITEKVDEKLTELFNCIDKNNDETDKVSEMLKVLHEKVDILAMSDDTDIRDEIEDIKQLILEQRKLFEGADDTENAQEIDNYLNQLLSDINKIEKGISEIDLEKNTQDIKDSVMTAILSVTDQISFVEETEEIKDFVEEKTNAINRTLLDVKKQLNNITNSGDDMDFYSYTLQDVETDIAKLRMILNDISTSNSKAEVGVISANINRIAKSIEDLRNSLAKEEDFEIKADFEKLNEDILSISARTNKLLLNSDESYRILCDSMDAFNRRTSSLEERLTTLDNRNIENRLSMIDEKVEETVNSNKVLKNVMLYLGEWMDGTSEAISGIYEKASKASAMRGVLDELLETVPDKENLIKTIEEKFEEQQSRIDRLEKKLERAISIIEENDQTNVLNKIDKLEDQLSKLSLNIEKLTSYVDE